MTSPARSRSAHVRRAIAVLALAGLMAACSGADDETTSASSLPETTTTTTMVATATTERAADPTDTTTTAAAEPAEVPNAARILTSSHGTLDAALALDLPVAATMGYSDRSSIPTYVPEALVGEIEIVGSRGDINFETIAAFGPDVILASESNVASLGMRDLAEEVARLETVTISTPTPWRQTLREVGAVFDVPQRAEDRIAEAEALFAELAASLTEEQLALEISVIRCAFGQCRYLPGGSSFPGMVLDDLGVARPELQRSDPEGRPFVEVSFEQIDLLAGDVVVLFGTDAEAELEQLQRSALWDLIPAVQNDRVFTVDGDAWFFGNVFAAEWVARDMVDIVQTAAPA